MAKPHPNKVRDAIGRLKHERLVECLRRMFDYDIEYEKKVAELQKQCEKETGHEFIPNGKDADGNDSFWCRVCGKKVIKLSGSGIKRS